MATGRPQWARTEKDGLRKQEEGCTLSPDPAPRGEAGQEDKAAHIGLPTNPKRPLLIYIIIEVIYITIKALS